MQRRDLAPVGLKDALGQLVDGDGELGVPLSGRYSTQWSTSAISVASLYVAVRSPVSNTATTR
jgi:hypothetical protein